MKSTSRISIGIALVSLALFGASCGTPSDGGVFKSEDQGETWAQKVFVDQQKKKVLTIANVNVEQIFFDPTNSDIMYMASKTNGIYKTLTAGEQWYQLDTGATRVRDIAIDPNDVNVLYSTRGTEIIKSVDAGDHWDSVYTDAQAGIIMQVRVDWFNSQHIIATTSIGTVVASIDGGTNWRVVEQVDEPLSTLIIDPTDSRIMYILELDKNVHRSTDGGNTWTELLTVDQLSLTPNPEVEGEFIKVNMDVRALTMDPNNSKTLFIATPEGIFETTDSGTSWIYVKTLIERGAPENSSIRNIIIEPGNSNIWYFTVGRIVYKTTDNAVTWKTLENFPSGRRITSLSIAHDRPFILYAGTELVEQKKGLF